MVWSIVKIILSIWNFELNEFYVFFFIKIQLSTNFYEAICLYFQDYVLKDGRIKRWGVKILESKNFIEMHIEKVRELFDVLSLHRSLRESSNFHKF